MFAYLIIHKIHRATLTRRNVLARHTGHYWRHQRQPFCRRGSAKLSDNSFGRQCTKTAKHKYQISASISATTMLFHLVKLPPTVHLRVILEPEYLTFYSCLVEAAQQALLYHGHHNFITPKYLLAAKTHRRY